MGDDINDEKLAHADSETQREVMIDWFRERFEDPAERTPYESGEGGYIWIWGGPYDAETELRSRFEDIVPEDVIVGLASDLSDQCAQWAPTPSREDYENYDEDLYEAVTANTVSRATLENAVENIRKLSDTEVATSLIAAFRRLLFANAITVLEAFLSDTFINLVFRDQNVLQKYLEVDSAFKDRKVNYRDILREASKVQDTVRAELLNSSWHNVGMVKALYARVLGIDVGDVDEIARAVSKRHDIVHRNGRRKDGTMLTVTNDELQKLLSTVQEFAARISDALRLTGRLP